MTDEPARRTTFETLEQERARFANTACPLCKNVAWDRGAIVAAPLVSVEGNFHLDEAYIKNDLYLAAVFTCQHCRTALLVTVGEMDLTEARKKRADSQS